MQYSRVVLLTIHYVMPPRRISNPCHPVDHNALDDRNFPGDRLASHDNGPDFDDDDIMGTPVSSASDAAASSPVARLDSGMLGPSDGVLPQSFIISTRFHPLLYLTAMMMPTHMGRPDIFVTISPKPHCAKVRDATCRFGMPLMSLPHRPAFVLREFMLHVRAIISHVVEHQLFGADCAYVCRVELQARGFPHCHAQLQ